MNQIDDYVLASCRPNWSKVAMVISRTRELAGLPSDDGNYELIAGRISALVRAGRLEAQGNLENWRGSEVRLPV
ncbi:MAG: hypothetical protein M3Q19_08645 [Pseudomonadota bacterium]|nr:hypothetical protein [Pseudomonadota bacterium]